MIPPQKKKPTGMFDIDEDEEEAEGYVAIKKVEPKKKATIIPNLLDDSDDEDDFKPKKITKPVAGLPPKPKGNLFGDDDSEEEKPKPKLADQVPPPLPSLGAKSKPMPRKKTVVFGSDDESDEDFKPSKSISAKAAPI